MQDTAARAAPPSYDRGCILIVEDEPEIYEILAAYLRRSGFRPVHAASGEDGLDKHDGLGPNLVLLDIRLPGEDGWSVLGKIRQRADTPLILLTACAEDLDKVMGLRLGADDYVVKPFNPVEVVARIEAVLRRTQHRARSAAQNFVCAGQLQLDPDSLVVTVAAARVETAVTLTLTEFKILAHLTRAPRRIFSRDELMAACQSPDSEALARTIDSHISKLRKKLQAAGLDGVPACVRGVGYKLGIAA